MDKNEELAREILNSLEKPLPDNYLDAADHYANVGEWGQVGTTLLGGAMRYGIKVPIDLVQKALDRWGPQEMGNLYSQFRETWLTGTKVSQAA